MGGAENERLSRLPITLVPKRLHRDGQKAVASGQTGFEDASQCARGCSSISSLKAAMARAHQQVLRGRSQPGTFADVFAPRSSETTTNERKRSSQILRFLTCGSVDDGKSTLIGRML